MILCIESATKFCSVALVFPDGSVDKREAVGEGYVHSEKLAVFSQELLTKHCNKSLLAVAVSQGPGSYTGLRIGVSLAKGLCLAKNIPLISFCGLEALASSNPKGYHFSAIDARKNEVFAKLFLNGICIQETWAENFDTPHTLWSNLSGETITIASDCAEKVAENFQKLGIKGEVIPISPSATLAAALVLEKFKTENFEDLAYFVPKYLKDFVITAPKK